jgi:hypothetical protein
MGTKCYGLVVVTPYVVRRQHDVSEENIALVSNFDVCHLFLLGFYLVYNSTLKMAAIYSSETSGSVRTARCCNPECCTLYSREDFRSDLSLWTVGTQLENKFLHEFNHFIEIYNSSVF